MVSSILGIFYMDATTREQAAAVHHDFTKHFALPSFPLWHMSLSDGFTADPTLGRV